VADHPSVVVLTDLPAPAASLTTGCGAFTGLMAVDHVDALGGILAPVIASGPVINGGSHLCAPNYCLRYRPAGRQSETIETSTSHIGFRCVVREDD